MAFIKDCSVETAMVNQNIIRFGSGEIGLRKVGTI
jgi:hypothetical protein